MVVIYNINIYIYYVYNNHLGHFFEIHRHMNEKTFCISCNWLRIHILIHCIWYIIGQEKVNKESRPPPIRAPCPVLHSSVGRWTTCKTSPAFGATGRECCKPGHFLCSGSESMFIHFHRKVSSFDSQTDGGWMCSVFASGSNKSKLPTMFLFLVTRKWIEGSRMTFSIYKVCTVPDSSLVVVLCNVSAHV